MAQRTELWEVKIEGLSFMVGGQVEQKLVDRKTGEIKLDPDTKEPLWTVPLMVQRSTQFEKINVTVAGAQPKVTLGQQVNVVGLRVGQYAMERQRNDGSKSLSAGLFFRAESITPIQASKAA